MNTSAVVSTSLFVLSTSVMMLVASYRRSINGFKPFLKGLSNQAHKAGRSKLAGDKTKKAAAEDSGSCQTKDKAACDACADKVNDMLGSVKAYDRHVIISVFSANDWQSDIDRQSAQFPYSLIKCIGDVKKKTADSTAAGDAHASAPKPLKLKLTAMVGDTDFSDEVAQVAKVIVYPDNIKFSVRAEQFEQFARFVSTPQPLADMPELVDFENTTPEWKKLILVCVHNARDKRCGKAGPEVISELRRQLEEKSAEGADSSTESGIRAADVAVRGSSHIGGHAYAGVMIVYPEGRWYGRISQDNSAELLQHLLEDRVYSECERGITTSKVLQW
jgi:hypothetical protein